MWSLFMGRSQGNKTGTKAPGHGGTKGKCPACKSNLKPHPFSKLNPSMSELEFDSFKADIAANGQQDDIDLFEGKILDGRHRYRALVELNLTPRFRRFKGDRAAALRYVTSKGHHRNCSDSQNAARAVNHLDAFEAEAKTRKCLNGGAKQAESAQMRSPVATIIEKAKASEGAAGLFGVSARYVELAKKLKKESPDLFEDCFNDKLTITAAIQQARRAHRAKITRSLDGKHADLKDCNFLLGDVVEQLETIPSKSVRIIFADPPYNIGKKYHADSHGDARKDNDFLQWCSRWLIECKRVLTPDGSIFIMINGLYAARLEMVLRERGFHRRNTIYWWENNPENQTGNFSDAVRPIHYFTRDPEMFVFNDDVRIPSKRNIIGDKRGLDHGKLPDNVWIEGRIPGNAIERVPFADAPPQLPASIPETCIKVASEIGDTVLDPFNGNGTTGIAALLNGRKYIGIDQSKKYLEQSRKWIASQLARRKHD
jgi:DNA modification methylase